MTDTRVRPGIPMRLPVCFWASMAQPSRMSGPRHYGPGSPRKRKNDRGVRRAIQQSQESLRVLPRRYGINQSTQSGYASFNQYPLRPRREVGAARLEQKGTPPLQSDPTKRPLTAVTPAGNQTNPGREALAHSRIRRAHHGGVSPAMIGSRHPVHPTRRRRQRCPLATAKFRPILQRRAYISIYNYCYQYSNPAIQGFSDLPCRFPATPSIAAEWRDQVYDTTQFFRSERAAKKFFP
jgi:hypothetical protein